jgi:hypothetical protein
MENKKIIKAAVGLKLILPAIAAILALVFSFLPLVRFTVDGAERGAVSAIELLSDMEYEIDKNEGVQLDGVSRLFLEDVKVAVAVFYIFAVLSLALSFYLAAAALRALSLPPKSHGANRAKVWLGFVFPRFFIVPVCTLLPLGVTLFPHLIYSYYVTWFGYETKFTLGGGAYAGVVAVLLLFVIDAALFAITYKAEREHQLDMWEKY